MRRTLSFILVLALVLAVIPCTVISAQTRAAVGELRISAANLEFASDVYLLIAVDYSEMGIGESAAKSGVTIKISSKYLAEPKELAVDESVMATEDFPDGAVGFKFTDLGAKNMGDALSIQAYYNGEASGEEKEYSILEYAVTARALYGDNDKLMKVCDKLLAFGAEAQKAYGHTGDYPLYDETGAIEYGMISVHGAIPKAIAPVGSVITPDAPVNEVEPLLYDYSFNRMENNEIVVREGINSYFFISAGDRSALSFDATSPTLTSDMLDCSNTTSSTKTKTVWTDADGNFYSEWAEGLGRQILQVGKASGSNATISELVKDEHGNNLALKMIPRSSSCTIQLRQRFADANNKNQTTADLGDVFTVSVVIGKEGTTAMVPVSYRFRGGGSSSVVNIFGFTNSGSTSTFCETGNTGAPIADVVTDGVGYGFVTVHMVIDLTAHTISYYADGSSTPVAVVYKEAINAERIYASDGYLFEAVLNRSGTVLLQKIIYTKGNIFE